MVKSTCEIYTVGPPNLRENNWLSSSPMKGPSHGFQTRKIHLWIESYHWE